MRNVDSSSILKSNDLQLNTLINKEKQSPPFYEQENAQPNTHSKSVEKKEAADEWEITENSDRTNKEEGSSETAWGLNVIDKEKSEKRARLNVYLNWKLQIKNFQKETTEESQKWTI